METPALIFKLGVIPMGIDVDKVRRRLEERLAQLEREQEAGPCIDCKWASGGRCYNPLVVGFDTDGWKLNYDYYPSPGHVCGKEKALFEPKPLEVSFWKGVLQWLRK